MVFIEQPWLCLCHVTTGKQFIKGCLNLRHDDDVAVELIIYVEREGLKIRVFLSP